MLVSFSVLFFFTAISDCETATIHSMLMAEQVQEGLVEVVPAPIYGKGHMTLRATCNIPAGMTIVRENPAAYVPLFTFHSPSASSSKTPTTTTIVPDASATINVEMADFSVTPLDQAALDTNARSKNDYFKAGWPYMSPFLTALPSVGREHLQLACLLILRNPLLAKSMATGRSAGGYCPDEKLAGKSSLTFLQFRMAMRTLCFFGVRRSIAKHWVKFENFCNLYESVLSNAFYCATLITDQNFAIGVYPLCSRLNHSCRPNCMRIGNPR